MKYYSYKLEKALLKEGFNKITWDGRVKVFSKNLVGEHRIKPDYMIVKPEWYTFERENKMDIYYLVEIWSGDQIGSKGNRLFGIKPEMVIETVKFLERIHESNT